MIEHGFPTKRIKYSLELCDQIYLNSLGSNKTCASETDSIKYLDNLYVSTQYDIIKADLNNIRKNVDSEHKFNTSHGLLIKENSFI